MSLYEDRSMIQIFTTDDGRRIYRVPQELLDVARQVFVDEDSTGAIFLLARRLTAHDLHTCELIAMNTGASEALEFAKRHLIECRV